MVDELAKKTSLLFIPVSSLAVFPLERLEQALEVPGSNSIKVIALDHLNEDRRPFSNKICKDLEQIIRARRSQLVF